MGCKNFSAEWLVRRVFSNEIFLYEFINKYSKEKIKRYLSLIPEMLHHLIDIKRSEKLLELGFQRKGMLFLKTYLFDAFVDVHLHRVENNF